MAKIPPLTEMQVRNAKPKEKAYKLFDGGGLYMEVLPSGSRIWRLKFRQLDGKENRLTFGPYPEVTLQEAREKRLEARRLMLQGVDPAKYPSCSHPTDRADSFTGAGNVCCLISWYNVARDRPHSCSTSCIRIRRHVLGMFFVLP
jgi:hypothetical protein